MTLLRGRRSIHVCVIARASPFSVGSCALLSSTMAFGTRFVPAFASAAPLSLGGVHRAECSQKGVATATRRAVPVATMPAAIGKASAGTCSLLLAIAVGVLSAIPASAAALDDGQAIFEKSCAAYVVPCCSL